MITDAAKVTKRADRLRRDVQHESSEPWSHVDMNELR